jgi:hypothetical protein
MPSKKRSPLREKPLRYPGQSIDDAINKLYDDMYAVYMYSAGFTALAAVSWYLYIVNRPISPVIITIAAFVLIGYAVYRTVKARRELNRLKLARDGEMIVGQHLDELRQFNYQVFHDIPGDGFNIDHVVLTTHGFFTVETKTISKPLKGDARVHVENHQIYIDGYPMQRDPFVQGRSQAHWLRNLLKQSTGKKFVIKPVILFPGWFVDPMMGYDDVWVLNPKALETFIGNERASVIQEDVYLASYHLARYIRNKQAE